MVGSTRKRLITAGAFDFHTQICTYKIIFNRWAYKTQCENKSFAFFVLSTILWGIITL